MKKSTVLIALLAAVVMATPAQAATVRLSTDQKAQLQYLVEEEKLARDVYNYLATTVTTRKFSNIAQSEQMHMDLVSSLLKTYGISNPTATRAPGVFKNATLASLYRSLTTSGALSYASAMQAGITIETLDIADLQDDIAANKRSDIGTVLSVLLRGSQNHLAAFSR